MCHTKPLHSIITIINFGPMQVFVRMDKPNRSNRPPIWFDLLSFLIYLFSFNQTFIFQLFLINQINPLSFSVFTCALITLKFWYIYIWSKCFTIFFLTNIVFLFEKNAYAPRIFKKTITLSITVFPDVFEEIEFVVKITIPRIKKFQLFVAVQYHKCGIFFIFKIEKLSLLMHTYIIDWTILILKKYPNSRTSLSHTMISSINWLCRSCFTSHLCTITKFISLKREKLWDWLND